MLERYVLAVLYYSTSGPSWKYSQLDYANVCTWNNGFGVYDTEKVYGVFCAEREGSIDTLNLYDNNLCGTLPWELVIFHIRHGGISVCICGGNLCMEARFHGFNA